MKARQVGATEATDKLDRPKNFSTALLWSERTVIILPVTSCHKNIFSYFNKIPGVTALLTGNATGRIAGWNLHFFH